jgi:hypothetical protein
VWEPEHNGMTVAAKDLPPLKLHYGECLACRTRHPWGEAEALREETSMRTEGALRGMGPSTYTRIAEITPGRAISQQGLATTCKDPLTEGDRGRWEGLGSAHEPVGALKER